MSLRRRMPLNKLKTSDKQLFDKYLGFAAHELSVYNFANIYIWREFFDIRWSIIDESLCVFFRDKIGSFLYLPPLGKRNNPKIIAAVFNILSRLNKNPGFAHIENIEKKDLDFYQGLGLNCELKSHDYLCIRAELSGLKGNKFKSKRSSYNYFIKHYDFEYKKLALKDRRDCLSLYDLWQSQRQADNPDHVYQGLLSDSRISLKEALDNYSALDFQGGLVRVNKEIKGFTFGFELNPETFCVLYEITDLSIKGLAQFIFRTFTRELKNYKFINVMDDAGLENLKKVKLSYHPIRLIPAYIARKKTS